MNKDFCHEWGDLAMAYTSDEVMSEIIAESPPGVTKTFSSDLVFWRHHNWTVASGELGVLVLWRQIRLLF